MLPISVRSDEVLLKYNKFKKYLIKEHISIDDYIMNKFLNKKYSIDENNFPYKITDNMAHYVLWINPNYFKKLTINKLQKLFLKNDRNGL